MVDHILLPAVPEVADPVAGDSGIDESQFQFRHIRPEKRGDEYGVAVAEKVDVSAGGSSTVRDTVSGKKDFLSVFHSKHWSSSRS